MLSLKTQRRLHIFFIILATVFIITCTEAAAEKKTNNPGIAQRVAILEALVESQQDTITTLQNELAKAKQDIEAIGPHRSDDEILAVVSKAGYVTGPHTVDTTLDKAGIEALGFTAGPHTVDTNTTRSDDEILAVVSGAGYVTGPHTEYTESALEPYLTVDNDNNIYLTGANLHIRSGSGKTDGKINGLGNLIIGYNENYKKTRTGSHNLIIGPYHSYSSFGGLVAGYENTISGPYSSVSGGYSGTANGTVSSVSGGRNGIANGPYSSVSGGYSGTANNYYSSISGGYGGTASGYYSSVLGGYGGTASGTASSVSGGYRGTANGNYSIISGGYGGTASGTASSVSGGYNETANTDYSYAP